MSVYSKVVWSEGLFLRPQHFQQQDRYFERYVETRCQALVPHSWGFTELDVERDLLSIGNVGLRRAVRVLAAVAADRTADDDALLAQDVRGVDVHDERADLPAPLCVRRRRRTHSGAGW